MLVEQGLARTRLRSLAAKGERRDRGEEDGRKNRPGENSAFHGVIVASEASLRERPAFAPKPLRRATPKP